MNSWKTTASAIATAVVALGSAALALLDDDPATQPQWAVVIAAITTAIGLIFARDNDKTSEQVHAG